MQTTTQADRNSLASLMEGAKEVRAATYSSGSQLEEDEIDCELVELTLQSMGHPDLSEIADLFGRGSIVKDVRVTELEPRAGQWSTEISVVSVTLANGSVYGAIFADDSSRQLARIDDNEILPC